MNKGSKRKSTDSGEVSKRPKAIMTKDAFLRKLPRNLYTDDDPFYRDTKRRVGELVLDWK